MSPRIDPVLLAWVSANVIPFEARLRSKLRGICGNACEVDDLIQELYCRLLKLDTIEHIREPQAFLMQMAKNIGIDHLRRAAVVQIDAYANLDDLELIDGGATPERSAMARSELKWVFGLIANLPDRCKQVFSARRIYGLSQHETADSLGITENIVEKETVRGLKLISEMVARVGLEEGGAAAPAPSARLARQRKV